MSIKQVTVFGASGFVGRAIVRALARQGYLIKAACRRTELAEPVRTAGEVGQVMLVRANLRIPSSVAHAVAGSQAVVNAAALKAAGVIRREKDGVRLLANGELKAAVSFEIAGASKSAAAAVEKAGGTVKLIGAKAEAATTAQA